MVLYHASRKLTEILIKETTCKEYITILKPYSPHKKADANFIKQILLNISHKLTSTKGQWVTSALHFPKQAGSLDKIQQNIGIKCFYKPSGHSTFKVPSTKTLSNAHTASQELFSTQTTC